MWTHDGNFVEIYFSVEPPKVAENLQNGPEISSRTCKRVSGLPPRARGGGVLGEEREWGPWGSIEPWRRGDNSEEGVVVHLYLSMYKSLRGGGGKH